MAKVQGEKSALNFDGTGSSASSADAESHSARSQCLCRARFVKVQVRGDAEVEQLIYQAIESRRIAAKTLHNVQQRSAPGQLVEHAVFAGMDCEIFVELASSLCRELEDAAKMFVWHPKACPRASDSRFVPSMQDGLSCSSAVHLCTGSYGRRGGRCATSDTSDNGTEICPRAPSAGSLRRGRKAAARGSHGAEASWSSFESQLSRSGGRTCEHVQAAPWTLGAPINIRWRSSGSVACSIQSVPLRKTKDSDSGAATLAGISRGRRALWFLREHVDSVWCVTAEWSQHQAPSGSLDSAILLWDVDLGEFTAVLVGYRKSVDHIAANLER